ncbi:MAG TPA: class II glutamine amidotransferase [Bacteroidales bacterium]|nr:class II glutamine amidotransferase [Bacteroidales bacterium]HQH19434.1 class II glutamine amidotransferase [Bacteroidales bacterium]
MSEPIKHECGIALIRLLKPLEYYLAKYGTTFYGLNKLYLLMEKQHNRGQDGAGVACVKLDVEPGIPYLNRLRSNTEAPIKDIFDKINKPFEKVYSQTPERLKDVAWLKQNLAFTGELLLGHLRYGTFGKNNIEACHPFVLQHNWQTRTLTVAGNFNLTNVDEQFEKLINLGQHPIETTDTITILERIAHYVDDENDELVKGYRAAGYSKKEISQLVQKNLNIQKILTKSCRDWDGGYVISGLFGHGDSFAVRDPWGIRPAFYYKNDEVVVVASERPAIQTTFNIPLESVHELKPGHAIIIRKNGITEEVCCREPKEKKACSFERIYFSRGTDRDIYIERKKLGKYLSPSILKEINYDFENTVFSYIPNTASSAFYGLIEELNMFCKKVQKEKIIQLGANYKAEKLDEILSLHPRMEKLAVKDIKLRTFITQDNKRDDLVAHVYDVTYGIVNDYKDTIVVLDDSIVRGTTLKQSIIRMLDRLNPKKIIIASSAPQIRYPDCYGIDMAKLSDFIAFRAAIELLNETKQSNIINEVYKKSKAQETLPKEEIINYVKLIYKPFTAEQISAKIAQMLKEKDIKAEVQIIFQSIEDLHEACPENTGDWYFTGNYPTPGGNKVVNQSFINYIEGKNERAYGVK